MDDTGHTTRAWVSAWLVDSFLNEAEWRVKIRFRVIDFNLLWGY
jgi:hypothetical protein